MAETTHKRDQSSRQTMAAMLLPNLLLVTVTLLLIYSGVRISLRPLDHLRGEIEQRSPDDLHTLALEPIPLEVRPLAGAMNRLFERMAKASATQRRFLANAAHQLRTPLTAVQTELDLLAMRPPQDGVPPPANLGRIEAATERITHLVNQLLTLARSESASSLEEGMAEVALFDIVEASATTFLDQAVARDIDLGFEAAPAPTRGVAWLVAEALANLIDNALRYAGTGGHVTVRCGVVANVPFLEVEDDGPGIAPAERPCVVERFYRTAGTPGNGCGLGLAIVDEIARLHGARLRIADTESGRGVRVRIDFPARPETD
jgi:two-component system sensor histidine kinase TctE